METFSSSMESRSGDQLTLFAGDSPANPSPRPGSEKGETMSDISSPRCFELFERLSPVGSSLRTFAGCLVSNLDRFTPRLSHRWRGKVTRSLHFVFLLQPSGHPIDEIDCGLLPTVAASWFEKHNAKREAEGKGRFQTPLHVRIEMLSTPNANDARDVPAAMRPSRIATGRTTDYLSRQIAMLLPTPDSSPNHYGQKPMRGNQTTLHQLPTPRTSDASGASQTRVSRLRRGENTPHQLRESVEAGSSPGLKLQPSFVEWMQGFPIGWTDLKR